MLGTPKSGTTSLFNWILQHPEARQPQRKELHMWAPVLQPDKACLDRDTCSVVASVNAELAKPGVKRGGNQRTGSDTHEGHEGHEGLEAPMRA